MILSERPLLTEAAESIADLLNSLLPIGHVGTGHVTTCTRADCWQCRQRRQQRAAERRAEALLARLYVILGIPEHTEEERIP